MKRIAWIFLLLAGPALGDGYYNGTKVDCYCTDSTGGRVELGEMICLNVDGRSFIARCEMSLNNPIWREVSTGCLSSSLSSPLGQSPQPALDTLGVDAQI